MLEYRYHVETGPDGIRWVSVEPLMDDIVASIDQLMKLPKEEFDKLDDDGKHIIEMKILGLRTVHEFLGSIITADNLKKMKTKENTDGQSEQQEESQIILH
jgi:hypothetical protein